MAGARGPEDPACTRAVSDHSSPPAPGPRPAGSGKAFLVILAIGVFIGAAIGGMTANALARRHAEPRALMTLMNRSFGIARDAARDDQCSAAPARSALSHLQFLSLDIEPVVLPAGASDPVFKQYATDLRAAIAAAGKASDCGAQTQALSRVDDACAACHRDYR